VVVVVLDVGLAFPGGVLVVLDELLTFRTEPFFECAVEVLDRKVGDRTGRTESDDVAHDRAAGLLGEPFQRHVKADNILGDRRVLHRGALAVIDDD